MSIKSFPNLLLEDDRHKLKSLALPNLTPAKVGRAALRVESTCRVALNYKFIQDNDITMSLKKFASSHFKCSIENVEPVEVCVYDIFGYYYLHRDDNIGDRLGAVYVALNEDYEGGDIFFPKLGALVTNIPEGSAISWECGSNTVKEIRPVTNGKFWLAMIYVNHHKQSELIDTVVDTVSKESRKKSKSKTVIPKSKEE